MFMRMNGKYESTSFTQVEINTHLHVIIYDILICDRIASSLSLNRSLCPCMNVYLSWILLYYYTWSGWLFCCCCRCRLFFSSCKRYTDRFTLNLATNRKNTHTQIHSHTLRKRLLKCMRMCIYECDFRFFLFVLIFFFFNSSFLFFLFRFCFFCYSFFVEHFSYFLYFHFIFSPSISFKRIYTFHNRFVVCVWFVCDLFFLFVVFAFHTMFFSTYFWIDKLWPANTFT